MAQSLRWALAALNLRRAALDALPANGASETLVAKLVRDRTNCAATRPLRRKAASLVLLLLAATLQTLSVGCGMSRFDQAQAGLRLTSVGVQGAEEQVAPIYESEHLSARDAALAALAGTELAGEDLTRALYAEYDERMTRWPPVQRSFRSARQWLLALQSALDAWEAGDRGVWDDALPCAVQALGRLSRGLAAAGVGVPELLTKGIGALEVLTSANRCAQEASDG